MRPGGEGLVLAPDHLAGERQIRERAAGFLVVKERRPAEGWRLGEPDVARDDGAEHFFAEVRDQLRAHLVREVVAGVEHRAQHSLDRELGIGGLADLVDGVEQRREPFERVVLALHRDQHAVGGDEGVHGEHVERRRTVDEDDVEGLALRLERLPQPGLPADGECEEPHLRGGEILVRRQQREAALGDLHQRRGEVRLAEQHLTGAARER